jgi:mono/diheme cytochrome c family protein
VRRGARGQRTAAIVALVGIVAAALWLLGAPARPPGVAVPVHQVDLRNGETLFNVGGCLACHKPPASARPLDPNLPSGGAAFATPVGVFYPQNLTPDAETGLGRWSALDFVNAMRFGISPAGSHYFPAFPYASYRSMTTEDLLDLRGWLMSLPAVRSPARPPDVRLAFLARRGVGLWKRLALRTPPYSPDPARSASWKRGAYLVNAPGHCGECHTPKNPLLIADERRHLAGGAHPGGEGAVPSLRGLLARKKYKDAGDLTLALQHGETLGYEDLSSGGMLAIQEELARAPEKDVRAISEYLLSLE